MKELPGASLKNLVDENHNSSKGGSEKKLAAERKCWSDGQEVVRGKINLKGCFSEMPILILQNLHISSRQNSFQESSPGCRSSPSSYQSGMPEAEHEVSFYRVSVSMQEDGLLRSR